ncbi:serine/threonine-protein kinase [Intrasporangium sp. YIM S08009]|uniref:serine/threonine-protein kinase n=1 Tax=Intrasporangium zincisolvens TaxID=3080018 RepID=UPI002B05D976|nr:serine/threonine-protein kinase [Intrasporangium sp. YIM S08009]
MEAIGRYQLRHRLGSGAFATVWLAHDPDLSVPVAIKVLADNWTTDLDIHRRFLAEARLLRRIGDDRVVRVHDIGELPDGRPFFVMDLVDGGTVADVVRAGCPPEVALRLAAEAARGLQVLHDHGVVHRDVKPGNLLLDERTGEPHVVIADLGMAKALAESSGLTVTAGTPAYMAPEQAHGTGGFDQRADVYALAAVAYALLVQRPPFNVETGLAGIAGRDPKQTPTPVAAEVGAPADLDVLLRSALAHDPARRPSSATELADRLDALRERIEAGERPARPTRPGRDWTTGSVAALATAAFGVFTLATWLTLRLLG